ncbi:MAG: phosphoserine phosphatase SerB [Gammaproteobacteria bacterium]|nr:phosphoserine phosphatase SerB [Gammaproteobacteria bacterium]
MIEIVLINITGQDRPRLTAQLTTVLADYGITVLDIGQSVIHDALSLGMLVEVPSDSGVFKELLFKGHELGLNIRFTPIPEAQYEQWVASQGRPRHIVTLLGNQITAGHLARITQVVAEQGLNIDQISRLSGRISLTQPALRRGASVELSLSGPVRDISAMHGEFLQISRKLDLDVAVQEDNLYRRSRRLVCFDMDSTLIQAEVIDELAKAAGVGDEVAQITESAMRGEIDFSESFRKRLGLLKGMDESVLEDIAKNLPITDGAERLIGHLKHFGYKVAILSGGFTYFANYLKDRMGIDFVYANQLEFIDGKLTGEVKGDVIDGQEKARLLRELADREGISLEQVIAVGDGANDLQMLSIAGLGIAFHAKPLVKEQAQHSIATLGLDAILYLMGMRDREIAEIEQS